MATDKSETSAMAGGHPATARPKIRRWTYLRTLGPGLVTGAADDDPSGIATYSQAGAQFGFALLWTVPLTLPFMIAIQLVSARIGRVTGLGIVANIRRHYPVPVVALLVGLLVGANVINIAADIAAMGEALRLVAGGSAHAYAIMFACVGMLLQVFIPYRRYAPFLKWLTLSLLAYVATALSVQIPWVDALKATIFPAFSAAPAYLLVIVGVFGTTISPYLFFWQAAEEIEVMNAGRGHKPLRELKHGGNLEIRRIGRDTIIGMSFSNIVAFFIILTTAATLNLHGITNIQTSAQAAEALRPLAGQATFLLFSLGIIGTGLLAVPVLAGSAAYGVAEAFGWPASLEAKPRDALSFYLIIIVATLVGLGLGFTPIDPIAMLFWSAVLNGIVSVPIMFMLMIMGANRKIMGRFTIHTSLLVLGWAATALMALAVAALAAVTLLSVFAAR